MRCEEARSLLMTASDNEAAEQHLASCPTCFTWLEERDPLVERLRMDRPAAYAVPSSLAPHVLAAWRRRGFGWQLGVLACAGLFLVAAFLLLIAGYTYPGVIAAFLAPAAWLAGVLGDLIGSVAVVAGLLLDNPALLAFYLLTTVAICSLWVRLYQTLQASRRITG
jgi:anti-sigma factor RsiW